MCVVKPRQNVTKEMNRLKMYKIAFLFCNRNLLFFCRKMYTRLVSELKEALEPRGWLLTAAVPAPSFRIEEGFEVRKISKVWSPTQFLSIKLNYNGWQIGEQSLICRKQFSSSVPPSNSLVSVPDP